MAASFFLRHGPHEANLRLLPVCTQTESFCPVVGLISLLMRDASQRLLWVYLLCRAEGTELCSPQWGQVLTLSDFHGGRVHQFN